MSSPSPSTTPLLKGQSVAHLLAKKVELHREQLLRAAAYDCGIPRKVTNSEISRAIENLEAIPQKMKPRKGYERAAGLIPCNAAPLLFSRLAGAAAATETKLEIAFSSLLTDTSAVFEQITEELGDHIRIAPPGHSSFLEQTQGNKNSNLIFACGSSKIGAHLARNREKFDRIVFDGPCGFPPAVALKDTDPHWAANFVTKRAFLNGGQYTLNPKRFLIHQDIYDKVVADVVKIAKTLKVGDPLDPETDIGPMNKRSLKGFLNAKEHELKGLKLLTGKVNGAFVSPHVYEAKNNHVMETSVFAPILILEKFSGTKEAIERIRNSYYGNIAYIFGDLSTNPQIREDLEEDFGVVQMNPILFRVSQNDFRYGGKKGSGFILTKDSRGHWSEYRGPYLHSEIFQREFQFPIQ